MLANYQCGQNEILSVPSGDIIQVKTGDEIAINSIAFEVAQLTPICNWAWNGFTFLTQQKTSDTAGKPRLGIRQ